MLPKMHKVLLALLSTAGFATSSDTDGGQAPARRWTHPRGPASGSGRSLARPPASFGGIRWTYRAQKTILAPPVTWDGVAFVVDGASLVALDTETGRVVGRTTLRRAGRPRPAVWEGSVFLLEQGRRLVQFRHAGRTFARRWSFDGGPDSGPARILDGEIYLPTADGLVRLRAGSRRPVWRAKGHYMGEPAIYKDHVYALVRHDDGKLALAVHQRTDGGSVGECVVSDRATGASGAPVIIGEGIASVRISAGDPSTWALLTYKMERNTPVLTLIRNEKLRLDPLAGQGVLVGLNGSGRWCVLRAGKRPVYVFADKRTRPDLVVGSSSGVALSGILCFGTWAGDLNGNRILWHLRERKEPVDFRDGLRWTAVPSGDERLLVVPRDGKTLHAIGPEELGS